MEQGTLIGTAMAVFFLMFAMMFDMTTFQVNVGNAMYFWDTASILIVFGGTIASTFITFPMSQMKTTFAVAKNAFVEPTFSNMELIKQLVNFAIKKLGR